MTLAQSLAHTIAPSLAQSLAQILAQSLTQTLAQSLAQTLAQTLAHSRRLCDASEHSVTLAPDGRPMWHSILCNVDTTSPY